LRRRVVALFVAVTVVGAWFPADAAASRDHGGSASPVRSVGPDLNGGRDLPLDLRASSGADQRRRLVTGVTKDWLGFDEVSRRLYLKRYELRAKSRRVEVWVADDRDIVSSELRFPVGDCRNDERVRVGDRQVRRLARQFEDTIFPAESAAFGRPPARDGRDAVLPQLLDQPPDYYEGPGRRLVVLVDNVRDENFYDDDNSRNTSYIAGFFSSQYVGLFDRNVLTIDAFDWRHRLGPHPPDEPVPGDECAS
jgi:hypothetical protein